MIQVNLLPAEYRKVEGTPVARLLTVLAGVSLTAAALAFWGYVHFGKLDEVVRRRESMESDLASLEKQAARSQALLAEFKEYQKRRATIESIAGQRILWSKLLDQFADEIHNKGDTSEHFVWLTGLRTEAPRTPGSGGVLAYDGYSGMDELKHLAEFNQQMKDSEFFGSFMSITPPRGERVAFKDERIPSSAWKFQHRMDLKAPGAAK